MKKHFIKSISVCLAAILPFSAAACGKNEEHGDKEPINVSVYFGEFGYEWVSDLAKEWEKTNDGYYIDVEETMNLGGTIVSDVMSGSKYDLFINEDCAMQRLYQGGYLEDLSDILNDKSGGKASIAERMMDKELWDKVAVYGDKYYMLPYSLGPVGLVYDHQRFVDNGWLETENGVLTAGNDGVVGTYDDGQPTTMDGFKTMLSKIRATVGNNVFMYMGARYSGYVNNIAYAYLAQLIGEENYEIFYTHDSKGKTVTLFDGTQCAVSIEDGYKTWQIKGVDDAIGFIQNYLANTTYVSNATLTDTSFTPDSTHTKFLIDDEEKRAAFMVEGNWWEYGAYNLFQELHASGAAAYGETDYRFMLLPELDGQINDKKVVFSQTGGAIFAVKQKSREKAAAVKDFISFILSEENLAKTTEELGMIWNYKVQLTTEARNNMTVFSRNIYDMVYDEKNVKIHSPYIEMAATPIYNFSDLTTAALMYCALDGETSIVKAYMTYGSAAGVLNAIKEYNNAARWNNYLSNAKSFGFYG